MIEAALGRLGAMKSALLGSDLYDRLLGLPDERRVVDSLAASVYAEAARRAEEGASPAAVERSLWQEVFAAWARLIKFLDGPFADCALGLCGAFDVENIRRTVRRVLAGIPASESVPLWDLGRLERVSRVGLSRARSVKDVSDLLSGGPYGPGFELASHRLAEGETLFGFEQLLEVSYREGLATAASRLRGSAGAPARAYIERRNHFVNLRWALRLRFVKGMKAEEARQYLLSPRSARARAELDAVLASESLERAGSALQGLLGPGPPAEVTLRGLERGLRRAEALSARTELRRAFFQFSSLLAYFDVRCQEVRDIVLVLTGMRQGRSPEELRSRLGLAA